MPDARPTPIVDLMGFLVGEWRVERHVEDRLSGSDHLFEGHASVQPETTGLLHVEWGTLDPDGCALQSSVRRRYVPGSDGVLEVRFADGRLFHQLDLRDGTWRGEHLCGDDRYVGEVTALGPDVMVTVWRVNGPRKNMTLSTRYSREV